MTREQWRDCWQREACSGGAASLDENRYVPGPLPWDFREKVGNFLKPGVRVLDLAPGDGEFLLSLGHPAALLSVAVRGTPHMALCQKRLAPLGTTVRACDPTAGIPYEDGAFDLVISRQAAYQPEEVRRVLKKGGYFVAQQVGGQNSRPLARFLLGIDRPGADENLENQGPQVERAGFRILARDQAYPAGRFLDLGALCRYAGATPEEFPGFTVDRCLDRLLLLQDRLERQGFVENQEHRFILVAKNQKKPA